MYYIINTCIVKWLIRNTFCIPKFYIPFLIYLIVTLKNKTSSYSLSMEKESVYHLCETGIIRLIQSVPDSYFCFRIDFKKHTYILLNHDPQRMCPLSSPLFDPSPTTLSSLQSLTSRGSCRPNLLGSPFCRLVPGQWTTLDWSSVSTTVSGTVSVLRPFL